ncbi:hypothetical protein [Aureispira sp. CCB-E]|uniref:hypothetical protein n=1 Tax=Aureispira sp. CCB-E TaxID=3051121 RepID=UPI002868D1A3|nr:hypothetical protein [Aureispira sp. CCB-E]WMX12402.1 hypothetical protein QP953_16355 [Aureispira sp. CCB-E]
MSLGTLSEKRNTATISPTATTTSSPPKAEKPALKLVEETPKPKEPTLVANPTPTPTAPPTTPIQDKKCVYCGLEKGISLAFKGSVVLVLLALCFNLIKTAK